MHNYYQSLGLSLDATTEQIKAAYLTYAKRFHPDRNGGDDFFKERFQEIEEAKQVLLNPEKKSAYDRKLYAFFNQANINNGPPNDSSSNPSHRDAASNNGHSRESVKDKTSQTQENNSAHQPQQTTQPSANTAYTSPNVNASTKHWSDNWGYPLFFIIGAIVVCVFGGLLEDLGIISGWSEKPINTDLDNMWPILLGGLVGMVWYHFQD